MNWIHYSLIYLGIGFVISISFNLYERWKENNHNLSLKLFLIQVSVGPLILLASPLIAIVCVIGKIQDWYFEKKKEREEIEFKKKLGLRPDENYLHFSCENGVGKIKCKDCGHMEDILFFIHTPWYVSSGRQCPNCFSFIVESHRVINDRVVKEDKDFMCPKCGALVRKKDELYDDEAPLLCPKCHSPRLVYFFDYCT